MKQAVTTAAAVLCLGAACVAVAVSSTSTAVAHRSSVSFLDTIDATAYLRAIGLPGERLLAAGWSNEQVLTASQQLVRNRAQIETFTASRAQASRLQQERRQLTDDSAIDSTRAVATVDATLTPLLAQLDQQRTFLRGLVLEGASAEQRQALDRAAIGAKHGLPLGLCVAADSERAAIKLAAALRAEARAARTREPLATESQQLLTATRTRADVQAAQAAESRWNALRASLAQTAVTPSP